MLTNKQRILLGKFIGPSSTFNDHFMKCELLSPGAKVCWLEMAIKLSSENFLPLLDKLFATLKDKPDSALIIVHGLKLINDFYFNNNTKNGEKSLNHFFGGQEPISLQGFQQKIQNILNGKKNHICIIFEKSFILEQKNSYKLNLESKIGDDNWRNNFAYPPEAMVAKALTNHVILSIFSPGSGSVVIKQLPTDAPPAPKQNSSCRVRREYNNWHLVDVLRRQIAAAEQAEAASALQTTALAPPK